MPRVAFRLVVLFVAASSRPKIGPAGAGPRLTAPRPRRTFRCTGARPTTSPGKRPIPGTGHSSPIVWGDRVFVTTCLEERRRSAMLALPRPPRRQDALGTSRRHQAKLEEKHPQQLRQLHAGDRRQARLGHLPGLSRHGGRLLTTTTATKVWRKSPGKLLSVHGFCIRRSCTRTSSSSTATRTPTAYIVALDKNTGEENGAPTGPTGRAPTARRS